MVEESIECELAALVAVDPRDSTLSGVMEDPIIYKSSHQAERSRGFEDRSRIEYGFSGGRGACLGNYF